MQRLLAADGPTQQFEVMRDGGPFTPHVIPGKATAVGLRFEKPGEVHIY